MALTSMKRPAVASAWARPSKKPVVDPSAAKCKLVAEVLADSPLATSVQNMLIQAVPISLGVYADVRHEYQNSLVEMIGEALGGIGDALSAGKAAAQAKVEGANADKAVRDVAAVNAEETLAAATSDVAEAQAALGSSEVALMAAKMALKEADAAQKNAGQGFVKTGANKEAVDAAQGKVLAMKDAAGAPADVKEVLAVAKKNGCDESLVRTTLEVLKKEPSVRGTFDGLALQQLVEFFVERVDLVAKGLAEGEALKTQRAEAVSAAGTALAAAMDSVASGKDTLSKTMAAEKEAQAALKVATAAVKSFTSVTSAAVKELEAATGALESFATGAQAAYRELKERATPQLTQPDATSPPEEPRAPTPEAPTAEPIEADASA